MKKSSEQLEEKKIAPLDKIDERMVVITPHSWLVIALLVCLALILILWSFFGSISVYVEGRGISLTKEGVLSVPSKMEGQITKIMVSPGQKVKTGDQLALVQDIEQEVEIENALQKRDALKQDLKVAQEIAREEEKSRNEALDQTIESLRFALQRRIEQLPFLKKDLESKRRLIGQGLISAAQLEQAERALMEENIRIEDIKAKIESHISEREKSYKTDELKTYERLYREAENDVRRMQARKKYETLVSPVEGIVVEVQVGIDEQIKEGQSLVLIEETTAEIGKYVFYCYVMPQQGQKIKEGMEARLELNHIDPQKYGVMLGKVIKVSSYPVSFSKIISIIPSEDVVKYLTNNEAAMIEVIVEPIEDHQTISGYQWSSGEGPDIEMRSGYLCNLKVTVEKRRPISYLFPQWWVPGL